MTLGPRALRHAALAILLLVGLAAHVQAGHEPVPEGGIDHLNVVVDDLAPGEAHSLDILSLDHGGLRPGWIYLVYGFVQGDHALDVEFRHENVTQETWRWEAREFNTNTTKIQHPGMHSIVLTNPSNETVRYAFYYDQSCNCASKVIPLPGGVVLFNNLFPAMSKVHISYPLVDDWHVAGILATHDEDHPTADWPADFEILQTSEAQGPGLGNEGWGWLNFTFQTTESRMYYVHLTALAGADPDDPVLVGPTYDVTPLGDEVDESPAPQLIGFIVLVALLAALRRRLTRTA